VTNTALYYHPANASRSRTCELSFANRQLYLYFNGEKNDLRIVDLKNVITCEWRGELLVLITASETVECQGPVTRQIYTSFNNPYTEKPVQKKTYSSSHVFFLLLGLSILGVYLWLYFSVLPWVAERAVNLVPVDYEISLGEKLAAAYTKDERDDSATYFAQRFAAELELNDTYPIDVHVIRSEELNAFALPGGKIFIYSGLLEKMTSHEELVALLGHEVTHVAERHSLKGMSRGAASAILISLIFGDMSSWLISKADEFRQMDYSRELETEADNNGLKIMIANKVNPRGMLDLLELLKKENSEEPGLMKYLSTHPDTESRIANIAASPGIKKAFQPRPTLEAAFKELKNALSQRK
jgi:Zn-dependent protease with chaperone function